MTHHALLFTLASIGIAETTYLIKTRLAAEKPVCVIGADCHVVLTSQYSTLLGIVSNDVLGLIFYFAMAVVTALVVIELGDLKLWDMMARLLIYLATIFSLYLLYLQWQVIKKWCFWCVMSATTVLIMLIFNI